jgi:PAS domain S-box-containing protein
VGILLADAHDGTVFTINPAARETFGEGAFAGQNIREYPNMGLLDKDGRPVEAVDYPLARSIQRGETIEARPFLLRRRDGSLRPISVSSRPIRSDEGKLIGGLMMIRDPESKG